MRIPPDTRAKCEGCGVTLEYHVGSPAWQVKDHDYCGGSMCLRPKCRVTEFYKSLNKKCSLGTLGCGIDHDA